MSILELIDVGEVGSIMHQHIGKTEAELQFGNKFEERKIEIAAEAHFDSHISTAHEQMRLPALWKVGTFIFRNMQSLHLYLLKKQLRFQMV